MERIATALESIADSFAEWCKISQARFEKDFPAKPNVRDATITRPLTEAERLIESVHASPEEVEEIIGPNERKFLERNQSRSTKTP